jgi:ATP-binding cassette subfamily B (MDR/TAP) protein 1
MIYVMGDGMVLEKGTHNQLLRDEDGPYAKLVQAQKLKERQHLEDDTDASGHNTPIGHHTPADLTDPSAMMKLKQKGKMGKEKADRDIEKAALDEKPLGRTDTSRSSASDILKQRALDAGGPEKEYSIVYILKRMAHINRDSWLLYVLGFIAAAAGGMVYPLFGVVYGMFVHCYDCLHGADCDF